MKRAPGFAVLALPLLLAAAPAQARVDCKNAVSQNDMNTCAEDDYKRADAALNRAYQIQIKLLDADSRDLLKKAQRAWLAFRDAECTYQNAPNAGGSIYPLVYNGCLTTLTKARTTQINAGQN